MDEEYTQEKYNKDFAVKLKDSQANVPEAKEADCKQKSALDRALDIRKFEIQLYWERAKYFWAFIAAAFAGYGAIRASSSISDKTDLSVYISCLGIVFSFGWYCTNRGSKQWQENWENHVDLLEDNITGPLYKVVLRRPKPTNVKEWFIEHITGPYPLSVSKINQIISIYVSFLWVFFLYKALPEFDRADVINWGYVIVICITVLTCTAFLTLGRTYSVDYAHKARKREAKIE
jgi:hypothetical protein